MIGFVRSIGDRLYKEGIRVNAICPGVVKTPLLNEELIKYFPVDIHMPIEAVASVAMKTILEDSITDSNGDCVTAAKFHSQAIHVTGQGFYLINQPPFNDEEARATWDCMMGWR